MPTDYLNLDLMPDVSSSFRREVEVYIEFNRICEIDTMNEKYHAEATIEAKWTEFEPIPNDNYDPLVHWNPKLAIENANRFDDNQVIYRCEPAAPGSSNPNARTITETRKVKADFWERLELKDFPIDTQELSITVVSLLKPDELVITASRTKVSYINANAERTFTGQQKWRLLKMVKVSGVASYDVGSASSLTNQLNKNGLVSLQQKSFKRQKLVATCFVYRRPEYYLFNLLSLMFIITIMSLPIFSIDCKLPASRLGSTFTVLLTSISFKLVISSKLPEISYLTYLERYSVVSIFYVCIVCIWHSLVGSFWEKSTAMYIDTWMLCIFGFLLFLINSWILGWFALSYRKIRALNKADKLFLNSLKNSNNVYEFAIEKDL